MPSTIAGVDGCPGGWFVVRAALEGGDPTWSMHSSFAAVIRHIPPPGIIAIDIPIGLCAEGSRECDLAARRLLGPRRASSVFTAPLRPLLAAGTHAEASARRRAIEGRGMSVQAFAIMPKVAEVDAHLRAHASDVSRVYEVHPELTFAVLNGGRPLPHSKKSAAGRLERLALLAGHFGDRPRRIVAERPRRLVAADDVPDAFAALWTARRIARGEGRSIPQSPDRDEEGLPMAIFF
ncbi:DUF429 domain-containing protein [Methylocaldum sp. MU1018]